MPGVNGVDVVAGVPGVDVVDGVDGVGEELKVELDEDNGDVDRDNGEVDVVAGAEVVATSMRPLPRPRLRPGGRPRSLADI